VTEPADEVLVTRCRNGDQSAFGRLVERYQKPLFNGCLRIVNSYADAQDVVQTVFLKAYENLGSFDPRYKFFSWIYRMMVNESLNLVQSRKPLADLSHDVVSADKSPEEQVTEEQLSSELQGALMELEPDRRAIVVLKYFADLSYRELSFVFEVPEKTIKSRLYGARQALCGILSKRGFTAHG
jgi:RNA polymerase sigma-70 factor (ECF subfamily)